MIMNEEDYMLWLCSTKNMWHKKMRKILEYFGDAESVFYAGENQLEQTGFLKNEDVKQILESAKCFDIRREREKLEQDKIIFLTEKSDVYPSRLRNMSDAPLVLFVKGNPAHIARLEEPSVSVIGSRICSCYGTFTAEKFSRELSLNGINVISGMARGVDSAAHKGALLGKGVTVAVLGCGVDICYPPENRSLYDEIEKNGVLLSEYPPGTKPFAWQFPERNRIISGLSDCVIITEAKEKSGSLITARWALEQGIDVFAVPGRINDPLSQGCNHLIQEGAMPVTDVSDILLALGMNYKNFQKQKIFLEKENEVVYSVLGLYPQSIDEIFEKTNLPTGELYTVLLQLQLAGLIEEPVKNYYAKKN